MTIKLYIRENGAIDFDPEVPCLISAYYGFIDSEGFRSQGEYGLEMIRQKRSEYGKITWIGDLSKSEIFDDGDVEWTSHEWSAKAYELGLRYRAIVLPESIFASMNVRDFLARHAEQKGSLIVNTFGDIESAKEWCKAMAAKSLTDNREPLSVSR